MNRQLSRYWRALPLLLVADTAAAHFFGASYSLPIPFSLYAYGASTALIVSFVLVGYFVNAGSAHQNYRTWDLGNRFVINAMNTPLFIASLRVLSVFALALTIVTGLFGSQNSFTNFSMTFFWVAFALGFTYFTALVGNVYEFINPWRALLEWIERAKPGLFVQRRRYPEWLGYWPALLLYYIYIWVELFGHTQPRSLAVLLTAYTGLIAIGAWVFGPPVWLRYGEFFGVFLRLIAKMAPIQGVMDPNGVRRLRFRHPFIGLIRDSAEHRSLVLFVLFTLSSTAFDGAHETLPWVGIFWKGIYPVIAPLVEALSARPYVVAPDLFYIWQWLMLSLSPFLYYGLYLIFIWMTKIATRSELSVRELALRFAYTLIPIAFVYNVTHYYTLLITQAPMLVKIASDPFGIGWNLIGTRDWHVPLIIPDASFVWHSQVWLILAGHIVSVYLSHLQALQVFPDSRRAALSQIPMLILMVILTTLGLWILSLPIASGQIIQPTLMPNSS
jgi:hypothetical protein